MTNFTVGSTQRSAQIWIDTAAANAMDGPLVVYWYPTNGNTGNATQGLSQAGIQTITGMGGVVIAPVHQNTGGTFPWIDDQMNNYLLMDQLVACAEQEVGIDERYIHATGFSAGGLMSTALGYARSNYIASISAYSGGLQGAGNNADPNNKYAAMIFHGGSGDQVVINFQDSSEAWQSDLASKGHYAFICNHGNGHSQLNGQAGPGVIQFFLDHPYGTDPSPYAGGFPASVPDYCAQP